MSKRAHIGVISCNLQLTVVTLDIPRRVGLNYPHCLFNSGVMFPASSSLRERVWITTPLELLSVSLIQHLRIHVVFSAYIILLWYRLQQTHLCLYIIWNKNQEMWRETFLENYLILYVLLYIMIYILKVLKCLGCHYQDDLSTLFSQQKEGSS